MLLVGTNIDKNIEYYCLQEIRILFDVEIGCTRINIKPLSPS